MNILTDAERAHGSHRPDAVRIQKRLQSHDGRRLREVLG